MPSDVELSKAMIDSLKSIQTVPEGLVSSMNKSKAKLESDFQFFEQSCTCVRDQISSLNQIATFRA